MKKANQSCTAVFALGEVGGRGVEGEWAAHDWLQHFCLPLKQHVAGYLGGCETSATAIILKYLVCFVRTRYCGTSAGSLLVPHSIKRMQMRHSGGLRCPVQPHHSTEQPWGLMHHSAMLSGSPNTLPILGWLSTPSLCQGGVWQHCKGRLQRGWQLAGAGGGRQRRPSRSWGSSEVWPLWWACRCHFPCYRLQHVTDT